MRVGRGGWAELDFGCGRCAVRQAGRPDWAQSRAGCVLEVHMYDCDDVVYARVGWAGRGPTPSASAVGAAWAAPALRNVASMAVSLIQHAQGTIAGYIAGLCCPLG